MTSKPTNADEVSPDALMSDFRGRPVVTILAFTIIIHVVLIGVFSIGYLKNELLGEDTSALSEDERLNLAVEEATKSLRKIAERHGVRPQDLSERFSSNGARSPTQETTEPQVPGTNDTPLPTETSEEPNPTTAEPPSAIEKELQEKADGPDLPDLPPIAEEEDLFK